MELAEDKQWRVRLAIIEYLPLLAAQVGQAFFDEKLSSLCIGWLGDHVFSIRGTFHSVYILHRVDHILYVEAATANLEKIAKIFGIEWSKANILPKVFNLHSNTNYLYRMTSLNAVNVLCETLGEEIVTNTMLPLVLELAQVYSTIIYIVIPPLTKLGPRPEYSI